MLRQKGRYLAFSAEADSAGLSGVMEEHASRGDCLLIDSAEVSVYFPITSMGCINHSNSHLGCSAAHTCSSAVSLVVGLLGPQPAGL